MIPLPIPKNPEEDTPFWNCAAPGAVVDTENGAVDADLQQLITLWPQLAASVREALLQQATESLTRGP